MNDLSERLEVALGSLLESEKRVAELEAWKEAATQSATAWQPVLEWAAKNGCLVGKDIPHFVVAKLASNHADNVEKVKAALCEDREKVISAFLSIIAGNFGVHVVMQNYGWLRDYFAGKISETL